MDRSIYYKLSNSCFCNKIKKHFEFQTSSIQDLEMNESAPVLSCFSDEEFSSAGNWTLVLEQNKFELGDIEATTAFEILFKIYYVFNLKYNKNVSRLFNFMEAYFYNIEGVNPIGVVSKYHNRIK